MSNNDKTVFRQPTPGGDRSGGDRTVMRPRPGAARGGQRAGAGQGQNVPRHTSAAPVADVQAADFAKGKGLNPLVNLAGTLIAVYEKTRHSMTHVDPAGLHNRLCNELRTFEAGAREAGIRQEITLSARYILCSMLDESVLNTPWGSESAWAQRTLLSVFHNETSGGEKFFQILDRMRQSPAENIDMLELFYVCLSMGFEGKYRLMARGRDAIEQIRDDLFTIIRRYRGEYERDLATSWQGLGKTSKTLAEYVPVWVAVTVVVALMLFGFSGFRYWLWERAAPVVEQLDVIVAEQPEETNNTQNK
jgi:type IV / VI secretion system protein, DotU family